jgi:hypothetical protein
MIVNVVGERAGQVGLVESLSDPVDDPGSYGGVVGHAVHVRAPPPL